MSAEFIYSAQDFREDSLSRKSEGAVVTHESLEELRQAYLKDNPQYVENTGLSSLETSI